MKFLWGAKDGGVKSRVWIWGFESKLFGSIGLVKFAEGSRDAYHSHAFHSLSWVLCGELREKHLYIDGYKLRFDATRGVCRNTDYHVPSLIPIVTKRSTFHMVEGVAKSTWVLTFRGPWSRTWQEFLPGWPPRFITLTHGRKEVE